MTNLHFNYKDVFRAGRLGFSAKKMWIVFLGFLAGYIGYDILSYLAYIAAGIEIGEIWQIFRLMPMFPVDALWPWFSWVIWIIGALWWVCVSLLVGVAVSKITYEQLKGDEFYEIKDALKFAMKTGKSAILAPFVLILFILSLVVMGLILALITHWIPYFGTIFFAVMSIPAFAVCLFILYLVLVTLVALLIGPSIVGATGNDTFDTLFESFSVINDQPWRFITYQVLLQGVLIAGVVILAFFSAKAIFLGRAIIGIVVPADKLDNILMNAAYYVKLVIPPFYPEAWQGWFRGFIDGIGMPNLLYPLEYMPAINWAGAISSFILGIVYYFIVMFVSSLACSIYWAGNTVIFTVLVKKKDEKNLLEIKEEPLEEKPEEPESAEKTEEKKAKRGRKKEDEKEEEKAEPKEGA